MHVLFIEDTTWQTEGVTNNFLHLWLPNTAFLFCRWQQLNPRTIKEQITTTHHSETTPEQHCEGHTPMENMHADTVHTPTALFPDQKECLDSQCPPPNCEKQFYWRHIPADINNWKVHGSYRIYSWERPVGCRQHFTFNTSEPYQSHFNAPYSH